MPEEDEGALFGHIARHLREITGLVPSNAAVHGYYFSSFQVDATLELEFRRG